MNFLLEPLQYEFMQRGMAAAVMVGVICSVMGTWVILRGMAFLGDAMAHAILPGVAIAWMLQGNILVGALVAALTVALGIGLISTHDLNLAATRFDRVLLLNKELVADGLPAEVLREENLTRAFGSALLVTEGRSLLVDECCGPEGHDDEHEHGHGHQHCDDDEGGAK